jgi:hypothetical protein
MDRKGSSEGNIVTPDPDLPEERLRDRFSGSLLGGMLGDIIGAVVEGESPRYIGKTFNSVEDLLALEHVDEIFGRKWLAGRFTDDTQMTICVAQWLIEEPVLDGKSRISCAQPGYHPSPPMPIPWPCRAPPCPASRGPGSPACARRSTLPESW